MTESDAKIASARGLPLLVLVSPWYKLSGMIVYGDPSFQQPLQQLVSRLQQACLHAAATTPSLRSLLIFAGQLEQAIADANLDAHRSAIQRITDALASALVASAEGDQPDLACSLSLLQTIPRSPDPPLTVKIPEGYAIYALYPEQYIDAARLWAAQHPQPTRVCVIGIRSIGTSLSATVAATLQRLGHTATRFTIRPTGHPFERQAHFSPDLLRKSTHALIVDEGPGLSGSSMASVAHALLNLGVTHDRIALLPGHDNLPGAAASEPVRHCWQITPRYVGRFTPPWLADPRSRFRNLATGVPFERARFLQHHGQSRIFWKFAGLSATATHDSIAAGVAQRWSRLATQGWTLPLCDTRDGYIARPWIEGRPLTLADAHHLSPRRLGQYITAAAGSALAPHEQDAALGRLAHMIRHNLNTRIDPPAIADPLPSAGDGRLAPSDWILTPDGEVLKADCGGHDVDHTIVGRQSVAWDIAGAIVEWNLPPDAIAQLLDSAPPVPPAVLAFHRLAYAAFRMGQCHLCAELARTPDARERFEQAQRFYGSSIEPVLLMHQTHGP